MNNRFAGKYRELAAGWASHVTTSVTDTNGDLNLKDENEGLQRMPESNDSLIYHNQQSSQEIKPVSTQAVREYLLCIWKQYKTASKAQKSALIVEVHRNLGLHPKAIIRLLNRPWAPRSQQGRPGPRTSKYSDDAKKQLILMWHLTGYLCAERLQAALPEWLEYREHKDCSDAIKAELLRMSASTINRYLKAERAAFQRKHNTGTRRGVRRYVTQVPVRDLEHTPEIAGHCEIDCVAHCGGSLTGAFAWTLTVTDIATGWTECEAMLGKDGSLVRHALQAIEKRLPFRILALYCDNGSEFMNQDIIESFAKNGREAPLNIFRSRPRRKNDQCYVEQKNYTHVRKLFGYGRIDCKLGVQCMNNLYRKEWRDLQNFFLPQQKLIGKWREGSQIKRKMSKPVTPYERLLALRSDLRDALEKEKSILNPFSLRTNQKAKVRQLNGYYNKSIDKSEWGKMAL